MLFAVEFQRVLVVMMMMQRIKILGQIVGLFLVGGLLLAREWPAFGEPEQRLIALVGRDHFDFVLWEGRAWQAKAAAWLTGGQTFLAEAERKQLVLDYLALIAEIQGLEGQIAQMYTDPLVVEPEEATAVLQAEVDAKRAMMARIRPLAEAVVQEQVAAVLVEEGFGVWGQAWPPVMMHMTPLPTVLIVSPRERIERLHAFTLETGLATQRKDEMETAVAEQLDLSALVVNIGGMGTYPAMIQETSNLNWLIEVVAHEWSHHWMSFYPVGLNYKDDRVRVVNETIASIIDAEIAALVVARYYPEFLPPPPPEAPVVAAPPDAGQERPFNFAVEMAETRVTVDEMLAQGEVLRAEAYMEARRRYFVANGYNIRKLNQAYFAFYGAYAAQPGATGEDPIGPMLRDIRARSGSLREFMEAVAPVATFADLERIWRGE